MAWPLQRTIRTSVTERRDATNRESARKGSPANGRHEPVMQERKRRSGAESSSPRVQLVATVHVLRRFRVMSNRIVLVGPSGDVVLEGYSVLGNGAARPMGADADEPCPDTLRSATFTGEFESGTSHRVT
jgi:hypothetical protein